VLDGVDVNSGVHVADGVSVKLGVGVCDGVGVADAVNVAGIGGGVLDGAAVNVGVRVADAVDDWVADAVNVGVLDGVAVSVRVSVGVGLPRSTWSGGWGVRFSVSVGITDGKTMRVGIAGVGVVGWHADAQVAQKAMHRAMRRN